MNQWYRTNCIKGLLYGIALLFVFGLALCDQSGRNTVHAHDKTEHVHKFQLRKTGYKKSIGILKKKLKRKHLEK